MKLIKDKQSFYKPIYNPKTSKNIDFEDLY